MEQLIYVSDCKGVEVAVAQVFGRLLNLGIPVLTHHHADLYHDALWLKEEMRGTSFAFYYGVRPTGTFIGRALDLIQPYSKRTFAVTVEWNNGKVMYGATELVV